MLKPEQFLGQHIKNYQLIKFLSGGGFGYVYQAQHIKLKTFRAIKFLKPEHVPHTKYLAAFEKEAKTIASLKHPYILDIDDYDVFEEMPFIIMPFIEKGSLRQLHPRYSVLDTTAILSYIKNIASALQYAHDRKIVHRDIKPDNFLCGSQGILLADFGIAVTAHDVHTLTRQDGLGTMHYMAPEQYTGQAQIWSDQYSLAIVVYEWLCGKVPFTGTNPFECYQMHKEATPPSFKDQGINIVPQIEQVVLKGLAKNPHERFPDILAFALALEDAIVKNGSSQTSTAPNTQNATTQKAHPKQSQDKSFEQLWAQVLASQVQGDDHQTFQLLYDILQLPHLTPSQKDATTKQLYMLKKLIPFWIKQAEKAAEEGRWLDEIKAWQMLLLLEPTEKEIPEPLAFSSYYNQERQINERITVAEQNEAESWMYTQATQMAKDQKKAEATRQLKMLWENAPYYGDPESLGTQLGISTIPTTYKNALQKKRLQEKKDQQELERQVKKREIEKQEEERIQAEQERNRYTQGSMAIFGITGGIAGFVGGAIVVQYTAGEIPQHSVIAPLITIIEVLIFQMGTNHIERWVAGSIVGSVTFLILGLLLGFLAGQVGKEPIDGDSLFFFILLMILAVASICGAIIGGAIGQNGFIGVLIGAGVGVGIIIGAIIVLLVILLSN